MVVNWLADRWNTGGVATGQRFNQVCVDVCNSGWKWQLHWHCSVATSSFCAHNATARRENESAALIVGSEGVQEVWSWGLYNLLAVCRFARVGLANLLCRCAERDDWIGSGV